MPVGRETLQDLIDEIYPDLHHITSSTSESAIQEYFSQRVILAARNVNVDAINNTVLQMFPGDAKIYSSADSAFNDAGVANDAIPNEYLNTILVPGMPLHETILKLNCPIILLRNLEPYEGPCNGTRMVVTAMAERVIEAAKGIHSSDLIGHLDVCRTWIHSTSSTTAHSIGLQVVHQ